MTRDELLRLINRAARESWTELDLRGQEIIELPPEIGHLQQLEKLFIGRKEWYTGKQNPLVTLPPKIGDLLNLQELNLRNNKLSFLPTEIGNLVKLRKLILGGNELVQLPSELGRLVNLEVLVLSNNRLTNLPGTLLNLKFLRELHLYNIDIKDEMFSTKLGIRLFRLLVKYFNLTELKTLCFILDVDYDLLVGEGKQNKARELVEYLKRNDRLVDLKEKILEERPNISWSDASGTMLSNNNLPIDSKLLGDIDNPGNPKFILSALFPSPSPVLREIKLLVVGEGNVGKTSLVERLIRNQMPRDWGKTVGVDIRQWLVEVPLTSDSSRDMAPLNVNFWDFGGQEIYHATHQLFLTHRSLYLVVLDARRDEAANRLDYWLRHVQSFAGDVPIILVVNKSDQGRLTLDERGLRLKHPAIQAIIRTSCATGAGIKELRHAVETALSAMPHLRDPIPLAWFEVKEKLATLEQDTLPYDSYVQLCQREDITDEGEQRTLARFLHDVGAVLNFQDDYRLAGTHVLNPEWVTGGIYRILNAAKLQENGLLHLDDLDAILDRRRYPPEKQPFLLDIMHKFELSVPLDRDRYLIPGLLPKERPAFAWPSGSTAALEYRYAILPAAILSRLMVRLYAHIWQASPGQPVRWRNGLVIHGDGCRALIVADPAANCLSISLDGPTPQRRHLLEVLRSHLDEIHASFAQLEAEAWVPLVGQPGKSIRYQALLYLESRGIARHYDPANDVELDVYALLDGIEAPDERAARPLRQLMVERFNMDELRTLCFDLGLDIETWPNEGKPALVRNLVLHFLKQGRLSVLEEKVRGERPYL